MRAIAILLACVGGEVLVEEVRAAAIHVPADYSTIYAALDAAANGDIVEVAPGIYDQFDTRAAWFGENVSAVGFLKDGVTLTSSGGPAVTILRLDSNVARPVILIGDHGDLKVSGFTFTGSLPDLIAIAIQTPDDETGSLHLHNCVIRDYGMGDALTHELAIDAYNASVRIQDCSVKDIDSPSAVLVSCTGGQVEVEDSSFKNCSGAAVFLSTLLVGDESVIVRRSSFENVNGAIYGEAYDSIVEDSFFHNAGGSTLGSLTDLAVRNNTFVEDGVSAYSSGSVEFSGNTFYGGDQAIYFSAFGTPTILLERNVVSFSTDGPAVEIGFLGSVPTVTSACNVFWQNADGNTSGFSLGATDLVADPQFCNASALDFTVNAASPCLPWNNNGCGQIGAWGLGCGAVSVEPSSWGQIKALYR